jgi:hypothetical protein
MVAATVVKERQKEKKDRKERHTSENLKKKVQKANKKKLSSAENIKAANEPEKRSVLYRKKSFFDIILCKNKKCYL